MNSAGVMNQVIIKINDDDTNLENQERENVLFICFLS